MGTTTTRTRTVTGGLGRRVPTDDNHVRRFPFSAVAPPTVAKAERSLRIPSKASRAITANQGAEGACVGFGCSMMMRILNGPSRVYDCRWLWNAAKMVDEWPDTNPGDDNGTSVRAACDVLRTQGHVLVKKGTDFPCSMEEGIAENRWAQTVDEMRTAIAGGTPVVIGVNWHSSFDTPEKFAGRYWIGRDGNLGSIRGGHCTCIYGVSDRLQAFRMVNSWGDDYPLVLLPFTVMERLLAEDGEVALVTDRVKAP
jgi:hypothetical protein